MFRPTKPPSCSSSRLPPQPFGRSPQHSPPFTYGSLSGISDPGHLPPAPPGPFTSSTSAFHHNRPPFGKHFSRSPCSSFNVDGGKPPRHQIPHWNPTLLKHQLLDNSDKAGEEFLRCIAANEPLPDYLKGDMAHNMADALRSARDLKDAVKSDRAFQMHVSKSRSRSRGRSRAKSRGPSQGISRAKSKSRSRGRSRAKSRGRSQSRGRSKSRARPRSKSRTRPRSKSRARSRSKSRTRPRSKSRVRSRSKSRTRPRSKSRARSRSKSRSRSTSQSGSKKHHHLRSKSQGRRSPSQSSDKTSAKDKKRKRSPSPPCSDVNGSYDLTGKSLLEGLKILMSSKELEERLPSLKDAIMQVKATDANQDLGSSTGEQKSDSLGHLASLDNDSDSMLLPHERVCGDFSWLQGQSQEDPPAPNADECEDEEAFLYGNDDDPGGKSPHPITSTQEFQKISTSLAYTNLDCNKIKNILESVGSTDASSLMKQQHPVFPQHSIPDLAEVGLALPALKNPDVRHALESLQSLIKETKDKRAKSDERTKEEERQQDKQIRINRIHFLMNEVETLLKQEGLNFLTPVIGFYCQKCEAFMDDMKSAESHAANRCHGNSSSQKPYGSVHAGKGPTHHHSSSSSSSSSKRSRHSQDRKNKDSNCSSAERRRTREEQSERKDNGRCKGSSERSSHAQETLSIKDEMKKERMLITVSRGLTPPPNTRNKEQDKKEPKQVKEPKRAKESKEVKEAKKSSGGPDKDQEKNDNDEEKGKKKRRRNRNRNRKRKGIQHCPW